jgi:hypothetical protein
MINALWQLVSITKIKSHKSLKKILIATTLNTPKLRVRLWWHPLAGTRMGGRDSQWKCVGGGKDLQMKWEKHIGTWKGWI